MTYKNYEVVVVLPNANIIRENFEADTVEEAYAHIGAFIMLLAPKNSVAHLFATRVSETNPDELEYLALGLVTEGMVSDD